MKIGIDARLYRETGIGRYIRNLIIHLEKLDRKNRYYILLRAKDFARVRFSADNFTPVLTDIPWHSWQEQLVLPKLLHGLKLDLVHFPYFSVPFLYRGKFIITIHDLIIDHFATGRASSRIYPYYLFKRWAYRRVLGNALKKAVRILAISKSTKEEIIDHYGVRSEKISVTYDGLDKNFQDHQRIGSKKIYNFPYFLYVGNAYPHKNLERLISAYDYPILKEKIKLILVGEDDYFYRRLKKWVADKQLERNVIFHGPADDRKLVSLFSQAEALVIPSLMEGFGLPPLEAASLKCPLILADIPVFREIWQDIPAYFDPENIDRIRKVLIDFIQKKGRHTRLNQEKAKKIALNFDWTLTAKTTLLQYLEDS